ncbi:MAG: protease inhibitor I42 family protein [Candidatus Nanopelagicales bacterium]
MSGTFLNRRKTARGAVVMAGSLGLVAMLAACGSSEASTSTDGSASPSPTKKSKSATPSPTSASPTYTRKPTPTPTPTPTKPPGPLFVAALPDSVTASVGQRIVVQLPTEPNERWSASGSGGVTVSGTKYVAPPAEQPDAPGTSITTVTAKKAGTAKVTFTASSTNGPANASKKLTVTVK